MELTFYTALMIGLLGSAHCIGMCGGIVGAINGGLPQSSRSHGFLIGRHLTYNAGRIISYMLAGAVAGFIGSRLSVLSLGTIVPVGRLIAGLFMIALGFYLAGWWQAIGRVEKLGLHLWKRIEPLGRNLLPANTPLRTFGLGLVWGWLPCGLVYSALALSMMSATTGQGMLIMLGFGLGTLPALLAMGGIVETLIKFLRQPAPRKIAGFCIIVFGVYTCFTALSSGRQHHHHASKAADMIKMANGTTRPEKFGFQHLSH